MQELGYETSHGNWVTSTVLYDRDIAEVERNEDGTATITIMTNGKEDRVINLGSGETYTYKESDGTENTIYCDSDSGDVIWDVNYAPSKNNDRTSTSARYGKYGTNVSDTKSDGTRVDKWENTFGETRVTTTYDDHDPSTPNPTKTVATNIRTDVWGNKTTTTTTVYPDGTMSGEITKEEKLITGSKRETTTIINSDGTQKIRVTHYTKNGQFYDVSYDDPIYKDKDGRKITQEEFEKSAEADQEKTKEYEDTTPKDKTEKQTETPKKEEPEATPKEETPKTNWDDYKPSNGEYNNAKPHTTEAEGTQLNSSYENNQTAIGEDITKIANRTDLPEDHLSKLEKDITAEGVVATVSNMKQLNSTMEANLQTMQDCAKKAKEIKVRLEIKEKTETW